MNYQEEMELSYKYFTDSAEFVENPNLNKDLPFTEQLVSCVCMKRYIVLVNGEPPIPDLQMDGVFCPECGNPVKNFSSLSGHSAGCFNATISFLKPRT